MATNTDTPEQNLPGPSSASSGRRHTSPGPEPTQRLGRRFSGESLGNRLVWRSDLEGPNGCWIWLGSRDRAGYGRILVKEHEKYANRHAHRIAYQEFVGSVPEGLELDHLCRVRACVNPDHLEPVTRRENLRRSPLTPGSRTHCPQGHPYTPENTYLWTDKNGSERRHCRTCRGWRSLTPHPDRCRCSESADFLNGRCVCWPEEDQ